MEKEFKYTQIDGMLSLEEATAELVNIAKNVQSTHTDESAVRDVDLNLRVFEIRKAGINAILDLIDCYIRQKLESK